MAILGEIKLFGGDFAPKGWQFCDGRELQYLDYQALTSVIGPTQGENWANDTVYLPDLREVEKQFDNCRFIICTHDGTYPTHPGY